MIAWFSGAWRVLLGRFGVPPPHIGTSVTTLSLYSSVTASMIVLASVNESVA